MRWKQIHKRSDALWLFMRHYLPLDIMKIPKEITRRLKISMIVQLINGKRSVFESNGSFVSIQKCINLGYVHKSCLPIMNVCSHFVVQQTQTTQQNSRHQNIQPILVRSFKAIEIAAKAAAISAATSDPGFSGVINVTGLIDVLLMYSGLSQVRESQQMSPTCETMMLCLKVQLMNSET